MTLSLGLSLNAGLTLFPQTAVGCQKALKLKSADPGPDTAACYLGDSGQVV